MLRWRLGLDVGTASVGAVAVELDADGREVGVPWHHVRIFQEPNEKGQTGLQPKKAARRQARQQRRQLERRARRIRKIAHLAPLLGLDAADVQSDGRVGQELPLLRAQASRQRIELPDLLRVFLRMAKRRGYAGGFRAAADDKELGVVRTGSGELQREMAALAERRQLPFVTLGEYLEYRIEKDLPGRLKIGREGIADLFALREMLEQEFDQIWLVQQRHHVGLRGEHKGKPVHEWFREALFHQRPLRSVSAAVGLCPLEKHLPRAPRAQMAAQRFRIEKVLADLRWGAGSHAEPLSGEQREVMRRTLNTPSELTVKGEIAFKRLYKILEQEGCPRPPGRSLNLDRASREVLHGNSTLKAFSRLGLLEPWQALEERHQTAIINLLADLGSPERLSPDDWHLKFLRAAAQPSDHDRFRKFAPEVVQFINLLRDCEGYGRLSSMGIDGGRMAYSVKALTTLTGWLRDPHWREAPGPDARVDEEAATRECYPDSFSARVSSGKLSLPPKTGNDTVDVALGQVHRVVTDALRALGNAPAEIIVELGREVGLSPVKRNEWEKASAKNQRLRNRARDEIVAHGDAPSSVAIRRYLMWQEQGTHCPYCSEPLSLTAALDGQATHVDHIIPRSLTQVGRKRSEIVIAHAACNTQKRDRTPWQAFGGSERWRVIEERAKDLEKKKQFRKARLLLLRDFEREVLTDSSIADFADRQLHQTSWIARSAAQWLGELCPNVFAARGEFTAMMRRSWRLDTVIPEWRYEHGRSVLDTEGNPISREQFDQLRDSWEGHGRALDKMLEKRLDHRHHVVDALVIAMCSRRTYYKLASNYKASIESGATGRLDRQRWQVEPPLADIRVTAQRVVQECRISHKPDRFASGKMFQDTAYAEVKADGESAGAIAARKPLAELLDERSIEKTHKQLALIASAEVRNIVLAEFEARVASGETPKQALSRPVLYPRYGTEIRSVRVIRADLSLDKAVRVEFSSRRGKHSKLLVPDGNACLEVTGAGRLAKCRVIPIHEAANVPLGSPTGAVRRFFKGDSVIDTKDGSLLVVRQIKSVGKGKLILTPVFETRPVNDLKASDGLKTIAGSSLSRLEPANVVPPNTVAGGFSLPRD